MGTSSIILEAKNIEKTYTEGNSKLTIIKDSSFFIKKCELISFVGASGSGKSTLLQICGLLDKATSGDIIINGISTKDLSSKKLAELRKYNIGFVYQSHNLFPEFTALENVMIPLMIRKNAESIEDKAKELLVKLGLEDRIYHKPSALSGGEKQRVAIARALVTDPGLILADEPTGNLDKYNSLKTLEILTKAVSDNGSSLFMVTHDWNMTKFSNKIMTIEDKVIKYY